MALKYSLGKLTQNSQNAIGNLFNKHNTSTATATADTTEYSRLKQRFKVYTIPSSNVALGVVYVSALIRQPSLKVVLILAANPQQLQAILLHLATILAPDGNWGGLNNQKLRVFITGKG